MSSGSFEIEMTWWQKICSNILKQGPLPQHVGLILDGNRRYAKSKGMPAIFGHREGCTAFKKAIRWGVELGITEVTAYIFSQENWKRSEEEVNGLMKLFEEVSIEAMENIDEATTHGICIQFVGDWSQAPLAARKLIPKIMIATRYNTKARINIAFNYTSRKEIAKGIELIHRGVQDGQLFPNDIDEELISQSFHLIPSQPVDFIIRSSGEQRLSDFLLWQGTEAVLHFDKVLWPEFSFGDMIFAILEFQRNYFAMEKILLKRENRGNTKEENRRQNFINKLRETNWSQLENMASEPIF